MEQQKKDAMTQYAERCSALCYENDAIDDALFDQHHVFRGLRGFDRNDGKEYNAGKIAFVT